MSNGSWTFSTWFKRASRTTEDFLFYIGAGDGFSGNGDELQLRCPANADTLRLEHYNAANAGDITLISSGTATQNVWHHAAITFTKTTDNTGAVRLYLNGTQVGTPTTVTWALRQDLALVLGGITSTSSAVASRYFNGWLDDSALFRGALTSTEISSLAKQSITTFSGLNVTATVPINVLTPIENWRQTHFGTTTNNDLSDSNNDGETNLLEFSTGQNPLSNTRASTSLVKNGNALEFTYARSNAALADGVIYIVEWSDSLLANSWSTVGVTEQILTNLDGIQTVKAIAPAGAQKRFVRLRTVKP